MYWVKIQKKKEKNKSINFFYGMWYGFFYHLSGNIFIIQSRISISSYVRIHETPKSFE